MLSRSSRRLILGLFFALCPLSLACSSNQQNNQQNKNTNTQPKLKSLSTLYEGYLDIADCDSIHGWAWNQNDPETSLNVEIYDGTTLLATLKADVLRGDLVSAGKGRGKYSFTYAPPPALKDGKPHSIHVKIAGSEYELGSSPKTITCSFP